MKPVFYFAITIVFAATSPPAARSGLNSILWEYCSHRGAGMLCLVWSVHVAGLLTSLSGLLAWKLMRETLLLSHTIHQDAPISALHTE
jgi:hypothetical protein